MGAEKGCAQAVEGLEVDGHPVPPVVRVCMLEPSQELENDQVALAVANGNGRLGVQRENIINIL